MISADNEWALRAKMPSVLTSPEVLHALRIVPEVGPASYAFEGADGREVTATIPLGDRARDNGGGADGLITPLLMTLGEAIESGALPPSVRSFCIIGRQTASSAMWNAIDLKRGGVKLVGEPTGGKPNAPGNVQGIRLPNSQIAVNVCTRMYDNQYPEFGETESLTPDLRVEFGIQDYRIQRDPLLVKALE